MIGLLRSELIRARSRRLLWMLVVGSVLGVIVGVGIATIRSSPPSDGELAAARRSQHRDRQICMRGDFGPTEDQPPEGYASLAEFCDDAVPLSSYVQSDLMQRDALPEILQGLSLVVVLLGVLVAASLGGADWSTGSIATLLTWESRRPRVVAVRALVVGIVSFALTIFAQVVFAIAWIVGTELAGVTETASGSGGHVAGLILKISVVATLFGLVAFGVANIGRSTTAAIAVLLGYLVVIEGFLAGIWLGALPWLLVRAANVVISGVPLVDPFASASYGPDGQLIDVGGRGILLSVAGGWTLIVGYVIVVLAVGVLVVQKRDVT